MGSGWGGWGARVDVFTEFFSMAQFMLPDLLGLLERCIVQDIEDLADKEKALEVTSEKLRSALESLRDDTVEANATQLTTQEAIARMETILEHQRLSKELAKKPYKEIGLPQAKASKRTPLYAIVAYGRMYPMYIVTRGRVRPNETDIQWSETAEGDTIVRPDPARGIDPEKDKQRFDDFLQVVKDAPRLVEKELLLQMFVNTDSESFALFNEMRDEIVLRGIRYNWAPTNELPIQFEKGAVQAISLD